MPGNQRKTADNLTDLTKQAAYLSARLLSATPAIYFERAHNGEAPSAVGDQWLDCVAQSRALFLGLMALANHYRDKVNLPAIDGNDETFTAYADEVANCLGSGIEAEKRQIVDSS